MISIRIIQIIHISLKFNQRFFIFSFVNWCLQNGSVGKGICYLHHQIPVFNIQPHNMGKNNKYSRCIDTSLLFICLNKRLNYMQGKNLKMSKQIYYICLPCSYYYFIWKLYQCMNIQLIYIFTIIKIIELICVDLYQVLGCGVFAVGIWMQANRDSFSVVLPSHSFLTAASLVIIAGAITLVIGFVGCYGAIAENKSMMVVVSFISLFFFPVSQMCSLNC